MTSESDLGLEYIGNIHPGGCEEIELREMNRKLKDDYASLKHQFEEAVKVSEQVDALCEQNASLSKKNRELQAKIDELERRIEISSRLNDELNSKIQHAKESADAFVTREIDSLRQQLAIKENDLAELSSSTEKDKATTSTALRALEKEKNERDSSIEILLQTASKRFNSKFVSLHTLTEFIEHFPREETRSVFAKAPQTDEKLASKVAKLKRKNKELRISKKQLDEEVKSLNEKISLMKKETEAETTKAAESISEVKREQKIVEIRNQQLIEQIQSEKQALETQITAQKARISELTKTIQDTIDSPTVESEKIRELNAQIAEMTEDLKKASKCAKKMKKRATAFAQEIQQQEDAKTKLKRKNSALQYEIEELNAKLDQSRKEIKAILRENGDLKDALDVNGRELTSANQQLSNAKNALATTQAETKNLDLRMRDIEGSLNEKVAEMRELTRVNAEQRSKLVKYESTIKEQTEMIESMDAELKNIKNRHEKEQKPVTVPEEIPQSSWFCVDFPKDLCKSVTDIAKNGSMQVSARLRQALTTIARYYGTRIRELENKTEEAVSERDKTVTTLKSLLSVFDAHTGLSASEGEEPWTNTSLLVTFEEKLSGLCNERDRTSIEKTQLEDGLTAILEKLGSDNITSAITKIGTMMTCLDTQTSQVKQLKGQNKQLKKVYNQMVQQLKDKESEVDQLADGKFQTISDMINTQNEHEQEVEEQKSRVLALEMEIERMKTAEKRKQLEIDEETEEKVRFAVQQAQLQHRSEMANIQQTNSQEIGRVSKQLRESQAKIAKLKKRIEYLLNANEELERKLKMIREEGNDAMKSLKGRFADEMNHVMDKHNNDVTNLRGFIAEKESEVQNLASALEESKEVIRRLSDIKRQMEVEKNILEAKIASQGEEMDREKRLLTSKMKTLTVTTELKIQELEDELNAKFEKEKRDIYHFGASLFTSFFNPRIQLTYESYRKLLESAKDELSRMQKQETNIRRLVGALHAESAEEALARAIAK